SGIEFTALRLNVPNTRNRFLFPKHLAVRCLLCHKIAKGERPVAYLNMQQVSNRDFFGFSGASNPP
ncbi:MAG: hypothetical protein LBJ14_10715, partial [Desulfarculales bacterium]|nr:hypothetical protein [Desulfarculales bacterium]